MKNTHFGKFCTRFDYVLNRDNIILLQATDITSVNVLNSFPCAVKFQLLNSSFLLLIFFSSDER